MIKQSSCLYVVHVYTFVKHIAKTSGDTLNSSTETQSEIENRVPAIRKQYYRNGHHGDFIITYSRLNQLTILFPVLTQDNTVIPDTIIPDII